MAFDVATIADLRLPAVLGFVQLMLASRTQLINHPVIAAGYVGDLSGSMSLTKKVGQIGGNGYDIMTSVGDGSAITVTDLTDASVTVTIGRQGLAYEPTDGVAITGTLNEFKFAQWLVTSRNQALIVAIAGLATGFTGSVGATGVDATVQNHLDAKRTLTNNNAEGQLLAIYHTNAWADVVDDLNNNASGALQYEAASQAMRDAVGAGYQGRLGGVDVWTTTRVPTANSGADRAGMMIAPGAILWGDATPAITQPSTQLVFEKVLIETARDAFKGKTATVGSAWFGVAEGLDGAGVGIITDA